MRNLYHLLLLVTVSLVISSCSGTKKLSPAEQEDLSAMKSNIKFSTKLPKDGNITIKILNRDRKPLDLSNFKLYVSPVGDKKFTTRSVMEGKSSPMVLEGSKTEVKFNLFDDIKNNFDGKVNNYDISIAYKSDKPLNHTDERVFYYFSYNYNPQ